MTGLEEQKPKKCCCLKNIQSKLRCDKIAHTRYKHFCLDHQGKCKQISDDLDCQYLTKFIPKYTPTIAKLYKTTPYLQSGNVIGSGTYGQVRDLLSPNNNKVVKTIKHNPSEKDYITSSVLSELSTCQLTVGSSNLSNCLNFGIYDPDNQVKIYYNKYTQDGNTYLYNLYNTDPSNFDRKHQIMFQLATGLLELHSHHVAHLDLKPLNLLFKQTQTPGGFDQLAITDFGFAKEIYPHLKYGTYNQSRHVQTIDYRAPEITLGLPYSQSADIWSMGLIFFEILCNSSIALLHSSLIPYRSTNKERRDYHFLKHIFDTFGKPTIWSDAYLAPNADMWNKYTLHITNSNFPNKDTVPILDIVESHMFIDRYSYINLSDQMYNDLIDLLSNILVVVPDHRFDIKQVLMHPFFSKFTNVQLSQLINVDPIYKLTERYILPQSGHVQNWYNMNPELTEILYSGLLFDFIQSVNIYFDRNININYIFYTSKLFEIVLTLMHIDTHQYNLVLFSCFHIYLKLHEYVHCDVNDLTSRLIVGTNPLFTVDQLIDMEKSIIVLLEGNLWIPNELSYLKVLIDDTIYEPSNVLKIVKILIYMKLTFNRTNSFIRGPGGSSVPSSPVIEIDDISKVKTCLHHYGIIDDSEVTEEQTKFVEYYVQLLSVNVNVDQTILPKNRLVKHMVDRLNISY